MKSYQGKMPEAEDGWLVASSVKHDGVEWIVCYKRQPHSDDWINIKVCANGRASGKANYWFTRNQMTGQIGFSRDLSIMREHKPDLHARVEKIVSDISNSISS